MLGKPNIAHSVDHLDGNVNNEAFENLIPACNDCHAWKTGSFERLRGTFKGKFTPEPIGYDRELVSELLQPEYADLLFCLDPKSLLAEILVKHARNFATEFKWT